MSADTRPSQFSRRHFLRGGGAVAGSLALTHLVGAQLATPPNPLAEPDASAEKAEAALFPRIPFYRVEIPADIRTFGDECLTVRSILPDANQAQATQTNQSPHFTFLPSTMRGPMCTELPPYSQAIGLKTGEGKLVIPTFRNGNFVLLEGNFPQVETVYPSNQGEAENILTQEINAGTWDPNQDSPKFRQLFTLSLTNPEISENTSRSASSEEIPPEDSSPVD